MLILVQQDCLGHYKNNFFCHTKGLSYKKFPREQPTYLIDELCKKLMVRCGGKAAK